MTETAPESNDLATELERLGGEPAIVDWVDRFYSKVAQEALLAPLFKDFQRARETQCDYFVEFFGGPKHYTERHGPAFLRYKHRLFRIGTAERDAWMRLMMEALREVTSDAALVARVESRLAPIADAMINHQPDRRDAYFFQR